MSRTRPFIKLFLLLQFFVLAGSLAAQAGNEEVVPGTIFNGVSLAVADQTDPASGLLQMQVFITEPKPILKGKQGVKQGAPRAFTAVASPLGPFRDGALFSPGNDVSGVAVEGSGGVQLYFSSPLKTLGLSTDKPMFVLSYPVRATAIAGQTVDLTLDPNFSLWLDPTGKQYPVELKSGTMTVGDALSVTDITPAGNVAAGATISIKGTGFDANTEVDFGEARVDTQQFVNANLIQVTLKNAANIRGDRVRLENKSTNERIEYFPYQRTTKIGSSTHALIAASYPLFPQAARTVGYFRSTLHGTAFSGLALQNLNGAAITATLQLFSKTGSLLSTQTVTLGRNTRLVRDLVELFPGVSPADGTKLTVTASKAIQMLGLLGDDASGMVLPVPASSTP